MLVCGSSLSGARFCNEVPSTLEMLGEALGTSTFIISLEQLEFGHSLIS